MLFGTRQQMCFLCFCSNRTPSIKYFDGPAAKILPRCLQRRSYKDICTVRICYQKCENLSASILIWLCQPWKSHLSVRPVNPLPDWTWQSTCRVLNNSGMSVPTSLKTLPHNLFFQRFNNVFLSLNTELVWSYLGFDLCQILLLLGFRCSRNHSIKKLFIPHKKEGWG